MASLLNIGITGLNASQAGLVTTGHNISNASTPGYSRQSIIQSTQDPVFSGAGFFGTGTRIETVRRSFSQFLENQVLSADTKRSEFETYSAQIKQLENLLADSGVGLSAGLEQLFRGVQEVAANPSSVAARQSLISSGQALVSSFQSVDGRIAEIRTSTETLIAGSVAQINTFAQQIAELNARITAVQVGGESLPANDLLDQRSQLLSDLNQYVRVSTLEASDGSLSVFIGSGQALVVGGQFSALTAEPSLEDPTRLAVGLQTPAGGRIIFPEALLGGGQLGGALSFRSSALDPAQNQLGLIAAGLGLVFNEQHRLGQDLDGAFGGDFFAGLTPTYNAINGATSAVTVAFAAGGAANLTADEYLLTVDSTVAAGYVLTRRSDGAAVNAADVGLAVTLGATTDGDQFLLQPTRNLARDLRLALSDPRLVAAADPVLGNATLSNAGTARMTDVRSLSIAGMDGAVVDNKPDFGTITLTYDATNARFDVTGPFAVVPATLAFSAADAAGLDFTLAAAPGFSVSFHIDGVPADGDSFTLDPNRNAAGIGISDNRNMVRLGALQFDKTMLVRRDASGAPIAGDATATFQGVYAQMVSDVGNKARTASVAEQAQIRLKEQAVAAKEEVSGVNLDEEAANLVRYQQAYQASARVMQIAGRLFDEILSISR